MKQAHVYMVHINWYELPLLFYWMLKKRRFYTGYTSHSKARIFKLPFYTEKGIKKLLEHEKIHIAINTIGVNDLTHKEFDYITLHGLIDFKVKETDQIAVTIVDLSFKEFKETVDF